MSVLATSANRTHVEEKSGGLARILRENGLLIALLALFLFSLGGQVIAGFDEYNQTQQEHEQETLSLGSYLVSGHFIEATFENWESEFLQMAAYVLLTVFLRQKGSSESKKLDEEEEVDKDPREERNDPDAPWPVRKGGLVLKLYENSLLIAFGVLFVASFGLHALGGAEEYNQDQQAHGQSEQVSVVQYIGTSRFWFESFQNWQSEFLSLAAMVGLSIFLRQRGSPESKPVAAPHGATGTG